jgi:hypothetical protein
MPGSSASTHPSSGPGGRPVGRRRVTNILRVPGPPKQGIVGAPPSSTQSCAPGPRRQSAPVAGGDGRGAAPHPATARAWVDDADLAGSRRRLSHRKGMRQRSSSWSVGRTPSLDVFPCAGRCQPSTRTS